MDVSPTYDLDKNFFMSVATSAQYGFAISYAFK